MDTVTSQGTPIVTNTLLRNWEGERIEYHWKTPWSSWHNLRISTSTSRPMRKANSAAVLGHTVFKTIRKMIQHATGLKTLTSRRRKCEADMFGQLFWVPGHEMLLTNPDQGPQLTKVKWRKQCSLCFESQHYQEVVWLILHLETIFFWFCGFLKLCYICKVN